MEKDYEAITQAREEYNEIIERLTEEYNKAWAELQRAFTDAKAKEWAIRKAKIVKAGG